jgi:D-proline reductase (dithiol) PrdB
MPRLSDLTPAEREYLLGRLKDFEGFGVPAWVTGRPLAERRIAIVTTAGLHVAADEAYSEASAGAYHVIPSATPARDLVMSHFSTNFDRTGFQQDVNVVFPLDRLHELKTDGVIGSVAAWHYAFMGAAPAAALEAGARTLAGLLEKDGVDGVLLTPV